MYKKKLTLTIESPKPLSPDVWEWVRGTIEAQLSAANQQLKIKVNDNRP